MSTDFFPLSSICFADLFDGRLKSTAFTNIQLKNRSLPTGPNSKPRMAPRRCGSIPTASIASSTANGLVLSTCAGTRGYGARCPAPSRCRRRCSPAPMRRSSKRRSCCDCSRPVMAHRYKSQCREFAVGIGSKADIGRLLARLHHVENYRSHLLARVAPFAGKALQFDLTPFTNARARSCRPKRRRGARLPAATRS